MEDRVADPGPPVKDWLKVTLLVQRRVAEPVADLLVPVSEAGVELELVDQEHCQISAYLRLQGDGSSRDREIHGRLASLEKPLRELLALFDLPMAPMVSRVIKDQDWATSWQQHFESFAIVPGLVIRPSWEAPVAGDNDRVIEMDPGMAFGTGQHATTRMALELLVAVLKEHGTGTLLDVGTGTGILAMAGALFGVPAALALDNDPEAVAIARKNVRRNRLAGIVEVSDAALETLGGPYAIICANIVHDVLVAMAADFGRLAAAGGHLIVSGILAGAQEANLVRIFRDVGFHHRRRLADEDWVALLLVKTTPQEGRKPWSGQR